MTGEHSRWLTCFVRILLLCLFVLCGCSHVRQPNSTEALAEQKQQANAERAKLRERESEQLRTAVREAYVNEHPNLHPDIRKAILKEHLKAGMGPWDVIAAYSLWQYTSDPSFANYRNTGVFPEWQLMQRQPATAQSNKEEWVLRRGKDTQHLSFENGALVRWK